MVSMKKSGIFLILLTFFSISPVFADPVSLQTAETVAQSWIAQRTAIQSETYKVCETFTLQEKSRAACYVFNFNPRGWVIVSADDGVRPIIAYSTEGAYSPTNHPPAFDTWMDGVKDVITALPMEKTLVSPRTTEEWLALTREPEALTKSLSVPTSVQGVVPLIQTAWGQDFPYNQQCPADLSREDGHAVTGCVATAMAQIMKYHGYPQTGHGTHSYEHPVYGTLSADFGAAAYDFSKMPFTTTEYDTQDEIDEIARLFAHCGVSVEMNYGPGYSGANMENDARNALKNYFKFEESLYAVRKSNYTDEEWEALLKEELDASRPILYAGTSDSGGHSFICDGYDDAGFFHFNWGWEGLESNLNAYFNLDDLTPGDNNDYTGDQNAVIHIRPPSVPDLAYPYTQGFEGSLPGEWIFSGERAKITSDQSHSGGSAIMLSDQDFTGIADFAGGSVNIAALKINVPASGAVLSFWIKRENNNPATPSWFNKQIVQIRPQFGPDPLLELFNGDVNDNQWQNFSISLTPWKGTVVTLYFEVNKAFTTPQTNQWMYIDDVEILANETPVSDFKAQTTEACAGVPVQFSDLSSFFPTTWSWSFSGGNPATATEQNPMVIYDAPGAYTVSLTAGNGLGEGTTETKTAYVHIYNTPPVQCQPGTSNLLNPDFFIGIYNVTFKDISNTTGGSVDDNGYKDFSCTQIANLLPDTDVPILITVGPVGAPVNPEYVKAFIDYNNNGDFADPGELVFFSTDRTPGLHSGTVHTPQNPVMDTLLRMRVISDFYQISNACNSLTYGQAEDYGVVFDSGIIPGDLNNDKKVDLADAVVALKIVSGIVPANEIQLAADVNGDGKIGMQEVVYILQKVSGLRAD